MMTLPPDRATLDMPPPGRSPRGVYLANQWYGHQATLLAYMGLPLDTPLHGKIQIGWQSGTGLDAEQGCRLEVTHYRLPFYVWGPRHLRACQAAGLGWGHGIGAPLLYSEAWKNADATERSGVALGMPSHSHAPYWIDDGWRAWAQDFRQWARAQGLVPLACLHPADYVRDATLAAIEDEGVPVTCVGGAFWPGYPDRLVGLLASSAVVVTDRVCSPTFYAAALGRRSIVRGTPRVPGNVPADEWRAVEVDHDWAAREFPWTVDGSDGRDAALRELGAEFVRSPEELRALTTGDTPQVACWSSSESESYAENPTVNDATGRADVLAAAMGAVGDVSSVLEVGCGAGPNLHALRELAIAAHGVEPGARARALAQEAGFDVTEGSLPRVPLDDSRADLVLSAGVLIHVRPDMRAACIAELVRLARRYVLLFEYELDAGAWNGHVGGDDFAALLDNCGCQILAHGVQTTCNMARTWWLASVGNKALPL